jgi:hypothetical protein
VGSLQKIGPRKHRRIFVHNTAVYVIRLAEHDLERLIKEPKRFPEANFPVWTFLALLFFRNNSHIFTNYSYVDIAKIYPVPLGPYQDEDQSDDCLYSVFTGLNWYLYFTMNTSEALDKTIGLNTFDPDYFRKQGNHPYSPRISGMCHLMQFQTFVTSASVVGEALIHLVDDEIMRGVRYMLKHETIPIWVQFGTQIFLDIQDVLGKNVTKPLRELQHHFADRQTALKALRKGNDQVAKLKPFVILEDRTFRLTKLLDQDLLGSTISGPGLPAHPLLSTLKGVEQPLLRLHP